jgi:hypothetical protein
MQPPMAWPRIEELARAAALPEGVTLREWSETELATLPELLRAWYPTIDVGAESVFLEVEVLRTQLASSTHPERPLWAFAICRDGGVVGFQAFERQPASRTLHGRLGVLAPEARAGFLGALGFLLFETLGALMGAELLLVWVTLASKGQQLLAERRGFSLSGLVPGFDRDRQPDGRVTRVMEALFSKSLVDAAQVQWPAPTQLTPRSRAALVALFGTHREVLEFPGLPPKA